MTRSSPPDDLKLEAPADRTEERRAGCVCETSESRRWTINQSHRDIWAQAAAPTRSFIRQTIQRSKKTLIVSISNSPRVGGASGAPHGFIA